MSTRKIDWIIDGDGYHMGMVGSTPVAMISVCQLDEEKWSRCNLIREFSVKGEQRYTGTHNTLEEAKVRAVEYYENLINLFTD